MNGPLQPSRHLDGDALSDYAEGLLDAAACAAADAHLQGCAECRRELDAVKGYFQDLSALEPMKAPPNFLANVRARLPDAKRTPWIRFREFLLAPWRIIPVQVALPVVLGIVGVTAYLYQRAGLVETRRAAPAPEASESVSPPGTAKSAPIEVPAMAPQADKKSPVALSTPAGSMDRSGSENAFKGDVSSPEGAVKEAASPSESKPASLDDKDAGATALADQEKAHRSTAKKALNFAVTRHREDTYDLGNASAPSGVKAARPEPSASAPAPSASPSPAASVPATPAKPKPAMAPLPKYAAGPVLQPSDAPKNQVAAEAEADRSARSAPSQMPPSPMRASAPTAPASASPMASAPSPKAKAVAKAEVEGKANSAPSSESVESRSLQRESSPPAEAASSLAPRMNEYADEREGLSSGAGAGASTNANSASRSLEFILHTDNSQDLFRLIPGLKAMGARVLRDDKQSGGEYELEVPASMLSDIPRYLARYGTVEKRGEPSKGGGPSAIRLRILRDR